MILRETMLFAEGVRAFRRRIGTQFAAIFGGGTTTNGYNDCNRDATLDRHRPFTIDDSLDTGV